MNGVKGKAPIAIDAKVGTAVTLDAAGSSDRDSMRCAISGSSIPKPAPAFLRHRRADRRAAPPPPATHGAGDAAAAGKPARPALVSAIAPQPAGGRPAPKPRVTVTNGETAVATVMPNTPGVAHVILAVTDRHAEPDVVSPDHPDD